ncbi:MAG TPA: prepilin-type N-terminal cleavage/methylation domain-containing protein [Sumerlaeia bacterium]|nr:prepilin-type N-terminal cleavage/methylation domain-containing protein [Sumerlaeia bacterium]
MRRRNAFTLIELLIVVAIIAILAAIAVPNFLEAQMRSKVATVYADYRALKTAMEAYRVDNVDYIVDWNVTSLPDAYVNGVRNEWGSWKQLTTPIAYITSVPLSPFGIQQDYHTNPFGPRPLYHYGGNNWGDRADMNRRALYYIIACSGPDNVTIGYNWNEFAEMDARTGAMHRIYNPTNGTKSAGDILASNKEIYQ